jgi:site-specific DNA-methyltransferase (adenine-specific)
VRIPFEPLWQEYERIIKDNGAIVLFSSHPFTTDLIMSNRRLFRYEIIWEKTMKMGFYNANRMPLKGHENILVFYKKLPTFNPQMQKAQNAKVGRVRHKKADRCVLYGHVDAEDYIDTGYRYPSDVIHFSNWNGSLFGKNDMATKHPTQKPVPLCEYLIKTYTNAGDTVLDNCMGSGSTGVACVNMQRNFIGIELDDVFFDIAEKRIRDAEKGEDA